MTEPILFLRLYLKMGPVGVWKLKFNLLVKLGDRIKGLNEWIWIKIVPIGISIIYIRSVLVFYMYNTGTWNS